MRSIGLLLTLLVLGAWSSASSRAEEHSNPEPVKAGTGRNVPARFGSHPHSGAPSRGVSQPAAGHSILPSPSRNSSINPVWIPPGDRAKVTVPAVAVGAGQLHSKSTATPITGINGRLPGPGTPNRPSGPSSLGGRSIPNSNRPAALNGTGFRRKP